MKRHLLWTFDRGSFQWDILCLLILAFLFVIPRNAFHDVPDFMRVSNSGALSTTKDRNGTTIYTLKLDSPFFWDTDDRRIMARRVLEKSAGVPVSDSRIQPIRDWTGRLIGYAIWKEK